jgi:hypothetical protein
MAVWCLGQPELATCCLDTARGGTPSSGNGGLQGENLAASGGSVGDEDTDDKSSRGNGSGQGSGDQGSGDQGSGDRSSDRSSDRSGLGAYDGRNWFGGGGPGFAASGAAPPLSDSQAAAQGLAWHSLQYAFPAAQLERTVALLAAAAAAEPPSSATNPAADQAALLRGRVVEFKFLQRSNAALLGPNSSCSSASGGHDSGVGASAASAAAAAGASELVFAVNAYWALRRGDTRATAALEDVLRAVGGGRPHWGKHHRHFHTDHAAATAAAATQLEPLGGWLAAFPKESQLTFAQARAAADPGRLFWPG